MKKAIIATAILISSVNISAQTTETPSIGTLRDGIHHWNLDHKERNYHRYSSDDYVNIANNFVAYQNEDGGWPKNMDWLSALPADSVKASLSERYQQSTLDNRNIFPQVEYLGDVYTLTGNETYKKSALKGLEYILRQQKNNGGWRGWDVDAITFNDDVTTGSLELLLKIESGDSSFSWLDDDTKQRIKAALDKGIEMILKCQIVQNGTKTAWAQQYDNETFLPVGARTYELPAITANESSGILNFLMKIPNPSPEIVEAVKCAVVWLEKVKIEGIRIERIAIKEDEITNHEYPYDRIVVEDKDAQPIWARFYEIDDNTPFMCTRPGQKVWRLADVDPERRTGYAWYGYWATETLKRYKNWIETIEK